MRRARASFWLEPCTNATGVRHGACAGLDKQPVRIGIGIASGEVVAGTTGTQERATYTCVADTVDLAARLEAHTRAAGRDNLVDGATQVAFGDRVPVEAMGERQFKGKGAAVAVFAVSAQAQR